MSLLSRSCLGPAISTFGLLTLLAGPSVGLQEDSPGADNNARRTAITQNIWWNRSEISEALKLDQSLRNEFDALLATHLTSRRDGLAEVRQARLDFIAALKQGDMARARKHSDRMVELNSELTRDKNDLLLTVLGRLNAAQYKTLRESFPEVLDRPWIRGARGAQRGLQRGQKPNKTQ